jgi:hypothetical protein
MEGRTFLRRLALFLAPYLLAGAALEGWLLWSGETLPVRWVARKQAQGEPLLFLARFTDHTYALKLAAARRLAPEVLALGDSRVSQFRSAMFRPYSFYNAGNCMYSLSDYRRFLSELPAGTPRVLLVPLDFYVFHPDFVANFASMTKEDVGLPGSYEHAHVVKAALLHLRTNPGALRLPAREPLYGWPARGLGAMETADGIRRDGSFQYGRMVRGDLSITPTVEQALERVALGRAPLQGRASMDEGAWRELEALAREARARHTSIVAYTPAFHPRLAAALDASPAHGIWREFRSAATAERIRTMGITYFDLSRLEAFGGREDEMIDPFHPSEPAYIRMLLHMAGDPAFRALLPQLRPHDLQQKLAAATPLEAYRNEF